MNDQTPRPESGAGHDVPAAFSSNTSAAPADAPTGTPAYATAPTEPIPPGATLPLQDAAGAAPSGAAPSGAAFGIAAQPVPSADKPKEKRSVGASAVVAMVLAAALVGGGVGLGGATLANALNAQNSSTPATGPSTVTVNNPESVSEATAIASKVVPSVVTIEVSGGSSGGSGSGVVLDKQGHILTNAHVVTLDGAAANPTIRVTTSDGRLLDATVVGIDPIYDMAVIKVNDGSGLTPIEFADSSKLNVGALTVAVGAPLGLANSVTTGIVSALNRSIQIQSSALPSDGSDQQQDQQNPDGQDQQPFQFDIPGRGQSSGAKETISISVIQTDAAINPGNSGGALVDGDGKLIGINVAIASAGSSQTGDQSGNIGVGFAIPSDVAKRVAAEIIDKGAATHGLLGASVKSASSLQDAKVVGAAIAEVTQGGAAEAAGLKAGDIVTEFNGAPVTDANDLTAQVRAAAAGSKAEITFVRDGRSQTVTATLGTLTS
ncbi:putative serine protease PepD [Microbacterium resistens]|uniref:Serine protease PepD n=1 Tax=Microbacterium resistens TaxID=156977 RepID=A0ABU1S787_9MICO|nr:trypsin-like peptidase domain-containing protein [Microbacterium resistens]MDR6865482.1 putative serine protease PepD [Microbacterium resistens]